MTRGDNLSIGGRGYLMSMELELSEAMDSYFSLKWSSKGSRRTVRRRRTSLTCILAAFRSSTVSHNIDGRVPKTSGRKKSTAKSIQGICAVGNKVSKRTGGNRKKVRDKPPKVNQDPGGKESRRARDTPVSESEKLGVSILRRHFSDPPEFAPLKNSIHSHRCSLLHRQLPFDVDGSYNQIEASQGKIIADRNTSLDINARLYEIPDFSGILLLASAACDSSITDDIINAEGSLPRIRSYEGDGISRNNESCSSSDMTKERLLNISGGTDVRTSTANSIINGQNMASGIEFSSQNYKFAWDLNEPVELWDNPRPEIVNAEPLVADTTVELDICNDKISQQPYECQVGIGNCKHVGLSMLADDHTLEGFKVLDKPLFPCRSSVVGHGVEKDFLSISHVYGSAYEESQLEGAPVVKMNIDAERRWTTLDGDTIGPLRGSLWDASVLEDEKAEPYPVSMVDTETTRPANLIFTKDVSTDSTARVSVSLPKQTSAADIHVCDSVSFLIKDEIQAEKYASLCTGSNIEKSEQPAMLNHFAEDVSEVPLARTSACQLLTNADRVSGDNSHMESVTNSGHSCHDNSKLEMSFCLADSHPFTCIGSSNHDVLSSGSTSAAGRVPTMDVKMKNKCSVVSDENSNTSKPGESTFVVSKSSTCGLVDTVPVITVAPSRDGALSSHGTCKSYLDSCVNSPGEVKGVHSDCGCDSHASQTGTHQVTGLDKLELPSDDDSQYEEGEFRGSIDFRGEGELDGEETQCVDYGSDNTKLNVEATALPTDEIECKYLGLSETDFANRDLPRISRDAHVAAFQPFMRSSPEKDEWYTGCGNKSSRQLTRNGDVVWESWPEGCRNSRGGTLDFRVGPITKNQRAAMFDTSDVVESLRSAVGTPSRKYLRSRTEMSKHRSERSYTNASRSCEANDRDLKFQDVNIVRSFRTDMLSRVMDNKDRGEYWADSRYHRGLESRDSPGYHGPCNFTHSSLKNAAAAVAAKLESNGFVVSADGTIVKVGGARHPNRENASSPRTCHSVRRSSPNERDDSSVMQRGLANRKMTSPVRRRGKTDGYGPGMVNTGRREYHIHEPNHEALHRRDRNLTPDRTPLHLSQPYTSTTSRRRMWRHPNETNDRVMDMSPAIRRRSRSPYFKHEVVEEKVESRMRVKIGSPQRRSGFKGMTDYIPSSRNVTSPSNVSRWTAERNASPNKYRESKYKASPGKRLHRRDFSQEHRADNMESPE